MKNIEEQQIIIECPNTIFHLYIDSEDELSKVKVFMNNMKNVDSISLHDIYNWCNRQHVQYTTTFNDLDRNDKILHILLQTEA